MKIPVTVVFLEAFLGCSSASKAFNRNSQKASDSNSYQSIHVNREDGIANIHNYSGWNGWDAVWDYQKGLFATRLFRTRVCVVATMDFELFPSLEVLDSFKEQKQMQGTPLAHDAIFLASKTRVQNTGEFGRAIQQLCGAVPTYYASQEREPSLHVLSQGCMNVGILHLFGIYLCGNTPSC